MFNITGNFSQGAYMNGHLNGFQAMTMQREQDIQRVIEGFEAAIAAGYNPNNVKDIVFQNAGVAESDLSQAEVNRIKRKVEEIYQSRRML